MVLIGKHMIRWIGIGLIIGLNLGLILTPYAGAREKVGLDTSKPLVISFEKNRTELTDTEKTKLRETIRNHSLGGQGRVFVMGYADSSGNPSFNRKLAMKRAETVRFFLVRELKLNSKEVVAIGQGTQHPVADNRTKAGRAKNRRAEIYIAGASHHPQPSRTISPGPNMPTISKALETARNHIRRDQWEAALIQMDKAQSLGGEQVSDWHALNGILGFLTGAPTTQVRTYLEAALALDPHNGDAREFFSRVEARDHVAQGRVKADMGRSVQRAIAVSTMAQQYEYLTLFGAAPRYHHRLDHLPIDVWECLSIDGEPVVYYFDHSNIHAWALGSHTRSGLKSQKIQMPISLSAQTPASNEPQTQSMRSIHVVSGPLSTPRTIWESKLFQ
jgi:hypothetical protein